MRASPNAKILRRLALAALVFVAACKKSADSKPAEGDKAAAPSTVKIGLVTDVGGRGDQSFNDSALRGLEIWAAAKRYTTAGYEPLPAGEVAKAIPEDVKTANAITPLPVEPVVLQAKQQEDYEPNLELLVDDKVRLAVGVGFMLENAVEAAAKKNPSSKFLLIDSPILDASGKAYTLPNVRTVTFREQEGTFLAGALAGLLTKTNVVGFVGGMQMPLIRKFEAGFRAGVMTTNPDAAKAMLIGYTGSFDKVEAGKQVAQDMLVKNADVLFHAAGSDGLGVIAAAREGNKLAIGCDSDQAHVAPQTVVTSFIKHVDLAVYLASRDIVQDRFAGGPVELGLREGGVGLAPIRIPIEKKDEVEAKLEALKKQIIDGAIQVPATLEDLAAFKPPAK